MKRLLSVLLLLAAFLVSANVKIVGSTRSVTAVTKALMAGIPGYHVEVLLPAISGCPHDYSLTPADMKRLTGAKIVVLNGGGMEGFLEGVIERACPKAKIVDASKGILPDTKKAPCVNEKHCHHHNHHHNEHILASPGMAAKAVQSISSQLRVIFADKPQVAKKIGENTVRFFNELNKISTDYRNFAASIPPAKKRILVQHSIFDYLAEEAGFEVKGTIFKHDMQEPSASEAAKLIRQIRKEKISVIFAERSKPSRMTERIARESRISIIHLDANPENDSPEGFLQMFRRDLQILKKAMR